MPTSLPRTTAILVAAGRSERLQSRDGAGQATRKPFVLLEGLSVLEHACAAFARVEAVTEIVIVGHQEDLARLRRMAAGCASMSKVREVVAGGEQRADSVAAGVGKANSESDLVAIHDVARPLVRSATIERALGAAAEHGCALVAVPVHDTIKTSSDGLHSEGTLDRSVLWCAQTPQVFRRETFLDLLARARADGFRPTDDCAIWEKYVGPVPLVRGESSNFKLTSNEDLELAAAILRARANTKSRGHVNVRVGLGFDLHRLVEGRPCKLGGIVLPHPSGPLGHSDGDAVLHALADALLGAAGLDDLGTLFSDKDPQWKDADSAKILAECLRRVRRAGWEIGNCDIVIATEGPRIAPHRAAMRESIARICGIEEQVVNVKGKSLEGLGALAGGTGVAVQAVCLLRRSSGS